MWDPETLPIEILREFESVAHPPLGRQDEAIMEEGLGLVGNSAERTRRWRCLNPDKVQIYFVANRDRINARRREQYRLRKANGKK